MNLAALEAEKIDPDAYPVMLDLQGNLSEGTGANFFIVSDGVVRTPGPRSVLRGVSRQTVLDLCQDIGVPSLEEDLQAYDALVADEAFLTSTPYCLVPVTRFNGQSVGDGVPGAGDGAAAGRVERAGLRGHRRPGAAPRRQLRSPAMTARAALHQPAPGTASI